MCAGTLVSMLSYADPLRAGRHPFQTYLLTLACVASIPPLMGAANSGSVEALLPTWVGVVWSIMLLIGCATALLGSYWPIDDDHSAGTYVTGLFLERIGLALVWPSALVYACLIVLFTGWQGVLSAAIVAGFGWASRRRMRDVGKVFARAIDRK